MFEDVATKFDTMILDTINRLNSLANENNDSVYVVAYKGENEISKEVPLLRDFIERRHRIVNKTRYIKLHSTSYVISK